MPAAPKEFLTAVLLGNQHDRRRPFTSRRFIAFHLGQFLLDDFPVRVGQVVWGLSDRLRSACFNLVLHVSCYSGFGIKDVLVLGNKAPISCL